MVEKRSTVHSCLKFSQDTSDEKCRATVFERRDIYFSFHHGVPLVHTTNSQHTRWSLKKYANTAHTYIYQHVRRAQQILNRWHDRLREVAFVTKRSHKIFTFFLVFLLPDTQLWYHAVPSSSYHKWRLAFTPFTQNHFLTTSEYSNPLHYLLYALTTPFVLSSLLISRCSSFCTYLQDASNSCNNHLVSFVPRSLHPTTRKCIYLHNKTPPQLPAHAVHVLSGKKTTLTSRQ